MKADSKITLLHIALVLSIAIGINGCKKDTVSNNNTNTNTDTAYVESPVQSPEAKNVLLEMYTGISSGNCPQGIAAFNNVLTGNGGHVIGVAMHSVTIPQSLDEPINGLTTQVLGSADAQTVIDSFGEVGFRPMGAVDRVVHSNMSGITFMYDFRDFWPQLVTAQRALTTPVNLDLIESYDASAKTINLKVEMHYTAAQTDPQMLSVWLTEDSIVTAQLNNASPSGVDTFFVHNQILRKAITAPLGNKLNVNIQAGTFIRRVFSYQISNAAWKPEHMHIVAFVHKTGTTAPDVLQVKSVSVK